MLKKGCIYINERAVFIVEEMMLLIPCRTKAVFSSRGKVYVHEKEMLCYHIEERIYFIEEERLFKLQGTSVLRVNYKGHLHF